MANTAKARRHARRSARFFLMSLVLGLVLASWSAMPAAAAPLAQSGPKVTPEVISTDPNELVGKADVKAPAPAGMAIAAAETCKVDVLAEVFHSGSIHVTTANAQGSGTITGTVSAEGFNPLNVNVPVKNTTYPGPKIGEFPGIADGKVTTWQIWICGRQIPAFTLEVRPAPTHLSIIFADDTYCSFSGWWHIDPHHTIKLYMPDGTVRTLVDDDFGGSEGHLGPWTVDQTGHYKLIWESFRDGTLRQRLTVEWDANCAPPSTATSTATATDTATSTPATATSTPATATTTATSTPATATSTPATATATATNTPVSTPGVEHNNPFGRINSVPTCYGRVVGVKYAGDVEKVNALQAYDDAGHAWTIWNPPYWSEDMGFNPKTSMFIPRWESEAGLHTRMFVSYRPIKGGAEVRQEWISTPDVPALTEADKAGCERKQIDCTGVYVYFKAPNPVLDDVALVRDFMADSTANMSIFRGNIALGTDSGSFKDMALPYTGMASNGWFAYSTNDRSFYNGPGLYLPYGGTLVNNKQPGWQAFHIGMGESVNLNCQTTTTTTVTDTPPTATKVPEVSRCVEQNGRWSWKRFPADKAPAGNPDNCKVAPTQPPAPTVPSTGGSAPVTITMIVVTPAAPYMPQSMPGLGLGIVFSLIGGFGAWRRRTAIFA